MLRTVAMGMLLSVRVRDSVSKPSPEAATLNPKTFKGEGLLRVPGSEDFGRKRDAQFEVGAILWLVPIESNPIRRRRSTKSRAQVPERFGPYKNQHAAIHVEAKPTCKEF